MCQTFTTVPIGSLHAVELIRDAASFSICLRMLYIYTLMFYFKMTTKTLNK